MRGERGEGREDEDRNSRGDSREGGPGSRERGDSRLLNSLVVCDWLIQRGKVGLSRYSCFASLFLFPCVCVASFALLSCYPRMLREMCVCVCVCVRGCGCFLSFFLLLLLFSRTLPWNGLVGFGTS